MGSRVGAGQGQGREAEAGAKAGASVRDNVQRPVFDERSDGGAEHKSCKSQQ